jgi:hypothetical protein
MNSSATTNTSIDSYASLSFNIPKKEEKRDVEDEDKEAVKKVKTEFDASTIMGIHTCFWKV